jgi:hypothetical protein
MLTGGVMRGLFGHSYCLKRSLVLFHYLRRAGKHPIVHFGVARTDGRVHGHAWIELDGQPYAEAGEGLKGFAQIYAYPHDGA